MKKQNGLKELLYKIIAIIVVLLLSMNLFKHNTVLKTADNKVFGFFSMVRYGLIDYPVQTVRNVFKDTAQMWSVRQENDALKQKLDYDQHWQVLLDELQTEVDDLKALNGLDYAYSDRKMTAATIMNSSIELWNQMFIIDIGSEDGISVGDGVINANGIVGKVIATDKHQATISTISANNEHSQVAVKIKVSDTLFINGILQSYDSNTQLFAIRLLDTHASITQGMSVSTSGLGGVYPSGLYVGEIHSVKETADSLGTIVYLQSQVNFNGLKYVKVVSPS